MVQLTMKFLFVFSLVSMGSSFVSISQQYRRVLSTTMSTSVNEELSQLGLTVELEKYVTGFRSVVDDKLRYQQLFFLASKCKPMDEAFKIDQNKVWHTSWHCSWYCSANGCFDYPIIPVILIASLISDWNTLIGIIQVPGCLSTVHIHATQVDNKIFYLGDADAQMTKGLVAMLVNGLSGTVQLNSITWYQIQNCDQISLWQQWDISLTTTSHNSLF